MPFSRGKTGFCLLKNKERKAKKKKQKPEKKNKKKIRRV